ncbi:uncharacterized protein LOC124362870 [Homalodisca vitripennis]|uniref:uncharacterized protein LOC124362870 n=1 Tax=Homalodisca vitripennis TaxID=197043 RepID=UPI001EEA9E52|nr:uncharacterized protein LOC124362870 [Homalodisca vitripennis]
MRTLLWLSVLVAAASSRTVRVRPVSAPLDQDTRQAEFYAEQPEDDDGPILVSRQDTYGRAISGQPRVNPRFKPDSPKQPPVQTIRNYNKLNDDGSFTFGYEAADGSFKEETRGTDCVVRGKYGYIDPDGNKREFTYVSGNPCDPNAVQEEEEQQQLPDSGEENIPANANYPLRRPVARPRPQSQAPTTFFHQNYNTVSSQEEEEEEENIPVRAPVRNPARARPVAPTYRPSFSQSTAAPQPAFRPSPSPKAAFISQPPPRQPQAVRITPRPATVEPATTYRPRLLEVTATPTPTTYTKQIRPTSLSTPAAPVDFDEEFKKFQLENNVVSTTSKPSKAVTSDPIYSTELVFDPSSGQYNTVLYQALPQTVGGELNLRGRLQPYVDNPFSANPFLGSQGPLQYQQQLFQQNQAQLLQQSQQLFAQQQKKQKPVASSVRLENPRQLSQSQGFPSSLLQQEPQTFQPQSSRSAAPARAQPTRFSYQPQGVQSYYYVNPQVQAGSNNLAAGQIDAFLRGHSLTV